MAFDAARRQLLYFGGLLPSYLPSDQTWLWDGRTWRELFPAHRPSARHGHSMAFDSARGVIVLFGGDAGERDTWEWNGLDWTQRATAVAPPSYAGAPTRGSGGMVYDASRQRMVLFGGTDIAGWYLGETWEWDGSTWLQRRPLVSPPARYWHSMAYDESRGRVVVWGGLGFAGVLTDFWEWDGFAWNQLSSAGGPVSPPRAFVYDSGRQRLLHLGDEGSAWEWDGAGWALRSALPQPGARTRHATAYDAERKRTVLFGGTGRGGADDVTWEWSGSRWTPHRRSTAPGAAPFPDPRTDHAMAFDPMRGRVVLFGGLRAASPSLPLQDTWEWDGASWLQRTPLASPPPLSGHAMVYDSARQRIVLFGGAGQTWEWDGSNWIRSTSAVGPAWERDFAMAYDEARQRVVLFGGSSGIGAARRLSRETWEWDGRVWIQRAPSRSPEARAGSALCYDRSRQRSVLFGGLSADTFGVTALDNELWEWDGVTWSRLVLAMEPSESRSHSLTYDALRGRVVLVGGEDEFGLPFQRTWELSSSLARYETYGSACRGVGDPAGMREELLPYMGQEFRLHLYSLPPQRPTFAVLGASRTGWLGVPLPVSFGLPGCALFCAPDVVLPVANNSVGNVTLGLSLPRDRSLLGAEFFVQALVLDPTANSLGMVSPVPGRGVVGR